MRSSFSFNDVAGNFNKHLTGQLPWYDGFMDGMLREIASFFIRKDSTVYDLGCSTGNVESRIRDIIIDRNADFIPVDNNENMAKYYMAGTKVVVSDIHKLEFKNFSFATSILTMSFIHPFFRTELIDTLKSRCEKGGAILFLEKMENRAGRIGTLFNRITWANKISSGESLKMIVNKELGLSGVQFPLSERELCGTELVFAYGDFKGYLYESQKEG